MNKSIIVIGTILGLFLAQFLWATSSKDAQERAAQAQKQIEEMQQKQQQWKTEHQVGMPKGRGMVGKYQAVRLSDDRVLILDTASGDFWSWEAKDGKEPQYRGQIPENKK